MAAETDKKNEELEKKLREEYKQGMPSVLFLLGILTGVVLNLYANILHDYWGSNTWYRLIVSTGGGLLLLFIFWFVKRTAEDPIKKIEKEIEELKQQKEKK